MDVSDDGRFETGMASSVTADGMALELTDLSNPHPGPVLEAFWHDDAVGFDVRCHREAVLPFDVVERFVAEARRRLPAESS